MAHANVPQCIPRVVNPPLSQTPASSNNSLHKSATYLQITTTCPPYLLLNYFKPKTQITHLLPWFEGLVHKIRLSWKNHNITATRHTKFHHMKPKNQFADWCLHGPHTHTLLYEHPISVEHNLFKFTNLVHFGPYYPQPCSSILFTLDESLFCVSISTLPKHETCRPCSQ
jgi:hypothetical protein